jgi:hypothetical protein
VQRGGGGAKGEGHPIVTSWGRLMAGESGSGGEARSRGRETTAATGTAATTSGGDEQEETRTVSATLVA